MKPNPTTGLQQIPAVSLSTRPDGWSALSQQQAKSPYHITRRIGIIMSAILLPLGEMILFLAIFIALWDIRNEFLLFILGAGIILTGVGLALE